MNCPNCQTSLNALDSASSSLHQEAECPNCEVQFTVQLHERTYEDVLRSAQFWLSTARTDLQLRADIDKLNDEHPLRTVISEIESLQNKIKIAIKEL